MSHRARLPNNRIKKTRSLETQVLPEK